MSIAGESMPVKSKSHKKLGAKHVVKRSHKSNNYKKYYARIEEITEILESGEDPAPKLLDKIQTALDKLADDYGKDSLLGADRYALLHAQALIHYHRGETDDAVEFMEAAARIRGENYEFAREFIESLRFATDGYIDRQDQGMRINRSTYMTSNIVAAMMGGIAVLAIGIAEGLLNPNSSTVSELAGICVAITGIVYSVYVLSLVVCRLHDLNRSAWWLCLSIVPVANIILGLYLLIGKGNTGYNAYGPPNANTWKIWPRSS